MTPKLIHYIWLGDSIPDMSIKRCFDSWKKQLSDYQFIKWDLNNIPRDIFFVEKMIEHKKWAFASDYLRLYILYQYGGIYLDTDMFVYRSFDDLLDCDYFIGKESENTISAGIIGSIKSHSFNKECLNFYNEINDEVKMEIFLKSPVAIPQIITAKFFRLKSNLDLDRFIIYPELYFYPVSFDKRKEISKFKPTFPHTYTLHYWNASWFDEYMHLKYCNYKKSFIHFIKTFGQKKNKIKSLKNYLVSIIRHFFSSLI